MEPDQVAFNLFIAALPQPSTSHDRRAESPAAAPKMAIKSKPKPYRKTRFFTDASRNYLRRVFAWNLERGIKPDKASVLDAMRVEDQLNVLVMRMMNWKRCSEEIVIRKIIEYIRITIYNRNNRA